ncbi:hypothetical protein QBC37DRAFT_484706 [Rhypophila decipiens]|uniref:Uncharacterized protein n=1 Tax=Rhypophila decipiens TaxID=261697 RepID=A0AAN6Y2C7_9PEZI|nr:hypothetical protein QBC37DRAFT_484706 [Rhypophila decipiens]
MHRLVTLCRPAAPRAPKAQLRSIGPFIGPRGLLRPGGCGLAGRPPSCFLALSPQLPLDKRSQWLIDCCAEPPSPPDLHVNGGSTNEAPRVAACQAAVNGAWPMETEIRTPTEWRLACRLCARNRRVEAWVPQGWFQVGVHQSLDVNIGYQRTILQQSPAMNRASLYVSPPSSAYSVLKPFEMPVSNGSIWAISFTAKNGQIVNASLSVIYTFIFAWLWSLVVAATIYFAPHRFSRRRLVALVALRNTSSPLSALQALANFTTESMGCFGPRKLKQASAWRDTLFGLLFAALCFIVIIGGAIMGVFGPAFLQIGNVAPVKGDALFYPRASMALSGEAGRNLRGAASLRALSSVQVFSDAIGPDVVQVTVDEGIAASGSPEQPMYGLNYRYKITGPELGLKGASDLTLSVNGACRTEYGWLDTSFPGPDVDNYTIFGDPNNILAIGLGHPYRTFQPRATFRMVRNNETRLAQARSGNFSYAVMLTSALHNSTSEGTDPWYLTERQQPEDLEYPYRIKRGRPVLSCWHQDTWSCGERSVNGSYNLKSLEPLQVPQVLRDVLGIALANPPIQRLGEDAGTSAILSVQLSLNSKEGILNAQQSSIHQDMQRLILASYISTLNILGDTTRFNPSKEEFENSNWFHNRTKSMQLEGADGFVVFTPEVTTFSLTGLIVAACVAAVLLVMKVALTLKLLFHRNIYAGLYDVDDIDPHLSMSPINKDRWARFRAFSAIHLLRNTYEDGSGVPAKDWGCGDGLPEPREDKPLLLVRCKRGDSGCAGHIATQPGLLDEGRELQHRRRRRRSKLNSISTLLGESDGQYGQNVDNRTDKTESSVTATYYNECSSTGTTPGENAHITDYRPG